ncbi:MAG: hypothetical protein LAO08_09030 [Acidobacteriia bacterium]|nr:hypothetical protein [Terriglobia bacterium]
MEFRLTYQGPLRAANFSEPGAKHKHEIRRVFHPQLRRLWKNNPNLGRLIEDDFPRRFDRSESEMGASSRTAYLGSKYAYHGYNFVPLVTSDDHVWCGLEVLLLTPGGGYVLGGGDLDNRIKTLFDALRIPIEKQELGGCDISEEDEGPFFCLLQDDKLVSKVTVETDMLLEPISNPPASSDARLIIKVTLKPTVLTWDNSRYL